MTSFNYPMETFPTDDELDAILTGIPATSIYPNWETGIGGGPTASTGATPQYGGSLLGDAMLATSTSLDVISHPLSDQDFTGTGVWVPSNDVALSMTDLSTMSEVWLDYSIDPTLEPDAWDAALQFDDQTPYGSYHASQDLSSPTQKLQGDGGGDSSDNGRRKRCRIPLDAKKILDESFKRHKDDPYAPMDEIKALSSRTGLSVKQVRTYFANARARKLPPASKSKDNLSNVTRSESRSKLKAKSRSGSSGSVPIEIPGNRDGDQQDPMQRFLSSSPEEEGVSEEAVRQAAESMSPTSPLPSPTALRRHSNKMDAMSVDSGVSSNSGGESSGSQASVDSVNSRGRRRGRRRKRKITQETIDSLIRKPVDPHKKFQCTFCTKDFSQKYDWRRHEESVHFPQQEWVCMPDGPTYTTSEGAQQCAFCDSEYTSDSHLSSHNHTACATAPRSQRTFLRKDKLIQHLIQVHRFGQLSKSIQTWCRPIERKVLIACGLCCAVLPDWPTRVDHLATHFNEGITMEFWVYGTGGIATVPIDDNETLGKNYFPFPKADGESVCNVCSNRFQTSLCTVAHKRQEHKAYLQADRLLLLGLGKHATCSMAVDAVLLRMLTRGPFEDDFPSQHAEDSHPSKESGFGYKPSSNIVRPPTPIIPSLPLAPATRVIAPATNIVASSSQSLVARPQADWSAFFASPPTSPGSRGFMKNTHPKNTRQNRSGLSHVLTPAMGVLDTMEQPPGSDSMDVIDPSLDNMNLSTHQQANTELDSGHRFKGLPKNFNIPQRLHDRRFPRLAEHIGEDPMPTVLQHPSLISDRLDDHASPSNVSQAQDAATPGGGTLGLGALLEEARREQNAKRASPTGDVQMADNGAWLMR